MEQKILEDLTQVVHRLTSVTEDIERKYERRDENILVSCAEAARLLGKTAPTISAMRPCPMMATFSICRCLLTKSLNRSPAHDRAGYMDVVVKKHEIGA